MGPLADKAMEGLSIVGAASCISSTTYTVLARARKQELSPRSSDNNRFKSIKFGIKRLAKVECT